MISPGIKPVFYLVIDSSVDSCTVIISVQERLLIHHPIFQLRKQGDTIHRSPYGSKLPKKKLSISICIKKKPDIESNRAGTLNQTEPVWHWASIPCYSIFYNLESNTTSSGSPPPPSPNSPRSPFSSYLTTNTAWPYNSSPIPYADKVNICYFLQFQWVSLPQLENIKLFYLWICKFIKTISKTR